MHERVLAAIFGQPWAITEEKYRAVVSVLARRESDDRLSEAEIHELVGERRQIAEPYVLSEFGRTGLIEASAATKSAKADAKVVAVIPVRGIILPRQADFAMSESGTGIDSLRAQFRTALANPAVTSIVLDVDSPGGSVFHVDEFAAEIFAARGQKKVVAQIDAQAGSAAYYLASQAKEIAITPSGEVGSIGVKSMHADFSQALAMKGIKVTHIHFGENKVEGNQYEPLSAGAAEHQQSRVDTYGQAFVTAVARGRQTTAKKVMDEMGQGRMYGAAEAKKRGMVDRVATLDQTLEREGVSPNGGRVAISATAASPQVSAAVPAQAEITAEAEKQPEATMSTNATPAATAVDFTAAREAHAATAQLEAGRVDSINSLAALHNMQAKAAAWITAGTSIADVTKEIRAALTASAQPVPQGAAERIQVIADGAEKVPATEMASRVIRASAAIQKFGARSVPWATAVLKDPAAQRIVAAADPQTSGDFAGGGFFIADSPTREFIGLLAPIAVVRSLNPSLRPLINGSYNYGKVTQGVTAQYQGEVDAIKPSKVKGGALKATAKKLTALVPVSNDLLRYAGAIADQAVREEIIKALARVEDIAFIRYLGTKNTPTGLRYVNGAQTFVSTNGPSLANTRKDLGQAFLKLRQANVDTTRLGWIMSPRTEYWLMWQCADGLGNLVFQAEMLQGKLLGKPYRVTTQIPENIAGDAAGGANGTEVYLADFSEVTVHDGPQIGIETSMEASYDDGSGTQTSAFAADQTVIRAIVEHDLIVKHGEAVVIMTGATWGV